MRELKIKSPDLRLFLGVDGGQSHTEAVIGDEKGNVLGRGFGGASNHAEIPGGRERLQNAIRDAVGEALQNSNLPPLGQTIFAAAHCGMTGGALYKEEIIGGLLKTNKLVVGHDAPTALYGASAGKPGIVVIAGTGAVVYGENVEGQTARTGGLGFLFSDEGSGFWLAAQVIRLAIKEQDGLLEKAGLEELVLNFFGRQQLRQITDDFYNGKISRDQIAKLARRAHDAAAEGNEIISNEITGGCQILARQVKAVAERLHLTDNFPVAGVGGMFNGKLFSESFAVQLADKVPAARFTAPHFGPAIGALLLAYRQAGVKINDELLKTLENTESR